MSHNEPVNLIGIKSHAHGVLWIPKGLCCGYTNYRSLIATVAFPTSLVPEYWCLWSTLQSDF
jgi:hypothetical protein